MKPFRNEDEFNDWLLKKVSRQAPGLRLGVGDDAALVSSRPNRDWAVTADLTVENLHFSPQLHPPNAVGHRALARSLSDIAAMGGKPRFAVVSLVLSARATRKWIQMFYEGLHRLAERFGVSLVGGDTSFGSQETVIDITVIGEVKRGTELLRSGARPGDQIFVAGELGASALGLQLLRSARLGRENFCAKAVMAHLYPEPQCALGDYLARQRLASSAIDISDGLSTDLCRLARSSDAGACIWEDRIPVVECDSRIPRATLGSFALHGGEDYKLLFTVHPAKMRLLPGRFRGLALYPIGKMETPQAGIRIVRNGKTVRLKPAGYDHFRI